MADYMDGKLWVDEFVTHHRDLKEINEGFDDMHVSSGPGRTWYKVFVEADIAQYRQSGSCIRCVVDMTKI